MLLGLGRMMNPARGTAGGGALPRLTELVSGLTANWEPYYASSLAEALSDTTGNGHDQTAVGDPALSTLNGAGIISLDGSTQYLQCNSLAPLVDGEDRAFALAWVAEQNIAVTNDHWAFHNSVDSDPYQLFRTDNVERYYTARRDDASSTQSILTGIDQVVAGNHVLIFNYTGTVATLYRNGSAITGFNGMALDTGTLTWDLLTIGRNNDGLNYFGGKIALCAFKAGDSLSGAEVTTATDFLKERYAIS